MERIGTAVEFFKQQMRRRADGTTDGDRVNPSPPLRPLGGSTEAVDAPAPDASMPGSSTGRRRDTAEPIVYTRTRSVEVPLATLKAHRVLTAFGEEPLAHTYRTLCAQLLRQMDDKGWNVLGVTGPGRGVGKTLTAVNLAVSLAMESHYTVLLVDGDLHHPGVQHLLGLEEAQGLADHLLHGAPVEELLVHPGIRRLTVLPAGRRLASPAGLLGSARMHALASELKCRYPSRMIVYDLPSLHRAADMLAFSSCLDAVLMVVEAGRTTTEEVEHAARLLNGLPLIGTVLNKG